jgi:hypothetical protein
LIFGFFGPISAASGRRDPARRRQAGAELQSAVVAANLLDPRTKLLLSLGFSGFPQHTRPSGQAEFDAPGELLLF